MTKGRRENSPTIFPSSRLPHFCLRQMSLPRNGSTNGSTNRKYKFYDVGAKKSQTAIAMRTTAKLKCGTAMLPNQKKTLMSKVGKWVSG